MLKKRIITLTDQPRKWSSLQKEKQKEFELYIASELHKNTTNNNYQNPDLLIISQQESITNKLDIQSLSNQIGAAYTLIVPPENIDNFVSKDYSKITTSLFSAPTDTILKTDHGIDTETLAYIPDSRPSIHMNGYLLGPFHVLVNGLLINDFAGRKCKSLLAYLLCNNKRPNFRETLMEKFWPDVHPESARNSLNVAIHSIRQLFRKLLPKQNLLVYKHDKYFINPEIELKLDHEDFLYKIGRGKRIEHQEGIQHAVREYEEAIRLYKGDFLEDSPHEDWLYSERERIKDSYFYVLDRLSEHFCSAGKYKIAQHYCRKLLTKDNCREDIHRRMMLCLHRTGYRDLAVKQFQKCEQALLLNLDMMPGRDTLTLLEEIKKG